MSLPPTGGFQVSLQLTDRPFHLLGLPIELQPLPVDGLLLLLQPAGADDERNNDRQGQPQRSHIEQEHPPHIALVKRQTELRLYGNAPRFVQISFLGNRIQARHMPLRPGGRPL